MSLDLSPRQLLRWYLESGCDDSIGDMPMDRFALSVRPAVQPRPVAPPPAAIRAPVSADVAARVGTAAPPAGGAHLAAGCASLAELRQALDGFDGVALRRTARSTVFADGNPKAELMIIGEAPGQEEDRQGVPFVGRSGKLLDHMLASIGLDRSTVYITNVVPWRPLENRKPTHDEVAACLPFLTRHVELVDPKMLLLLGGASASALLGRAEGINRLRGQWHSYSSPGLPRPVPAMATFHPAYLLRTPAAKREAWRDLLQVRKNLEN